MARIYTDCKGYKRFADSGTLVHRWAAKKKVGGKIWGDRVVHHKDENRSNFRPGNLQVMSRSAHSSLHARKRRSWF